LGFGLPEAIINIAINDLQNHLSNVIQKTQLRVA